MEEKKKMRKIILFIGCLLLLALIIAIVLPAFKPAKDSGPGYVRVMCNSNMRQLVIAHLFYQGDSGSWPNKEQWGDLIKSYVDNDEAFQCYIDKIGPCSYAMNENIPADANELPRDLVLLFESVPGWNQVGGADDVVTDRHGDKNPGANIAFADGSVEFVKPEEIPNLRWTVEE